jgi:hypothetical protein
VAGCRSTVDAPLVDRRSRDYGERPENAMTTQESLLAALAPITRLVAGLDLSDPAAATAALDAAVDAATLDHLEGLFAAAEAEGWLTPRRATPTLTFGRLAKPSEATHGLSIDVVDMEGAGAPHTHPNGEVSLCFPRGGTPTFEGVSRGWAVLPPGSRHTPTALGGRMVIAYFLPNGAMLWE